MRAVVLFALMLIPTSLLAAPPAETGKPVDIVLCLDTSGSMDGLIDSAKRKHWTFVNDLAKVEPTPTLRVGLYSYGNNTYDASRGWVRLEVELTTDLDEVYKRIHALKTASTGSFEFPARVSKYALEELKWSPEKGGLRIIFVCGNEPVDQDKDVTLESVAEQAKATGILINTIYCGTPTHLDAAGWVAFATKCGGKASNIDQGAAKAEVTIVTPFDEEIRKLGTKINDTYLWFGAKGLASRANQLAQDGNAAKVAPGAAIERDITKAGGLYKNAACDLIDKMLNEKDFDLKKIKEADLPEELKKLKSDEREPYLKKKAGERVEIQKVVSELSNRRARYIDTERAKLQKLTGDKALDQALREILKEQATSKGLKVKD
ncbi:MAG: VWA domain-containing protein [Gemmataceae bacterium]|nr:VWA domain-containing protein [Gemmataceae bacterium]